MNRCFSFFFAFVLFPFALSAYAGPDLSWQASLEIHNSGVSSLPVSYPLVEVKLEGSEVLFVGKKMLKAKKAKKGASLEEEVYCQLNLPMFIDKLYVSDIARLEMNLQKYELKKSTAKKAEDIGIPPMSVDEFIGGKILDWLSAFRQLDVKASRISCGFSESGNLALFEVLGPAKFMNHEAFVRTGVLFDAKDYILYERKKSKAEKLIEKGLDKLMDLAF